jgi:hypothetical protein
MRERCVSLDLAANGLLFNRESFRITEVMPMPDSSIRVGLQVNQSRLCAEAVL